MGNGANEVVVVAIASAGRPELLSELLEDLSRQTTANFCISVSVPGEGHLPVGGLPPGVYLTFASGAAAQRNAAIQAVPDATHVFCFDDDSVVRPDYIEKAMRLFDDQPSVVALTGKVLLDGAGQDEISRSDALRELQQSFDVDQGARKGTSWTRSRELYGCNMAFRVDLARTELFEPELPLYSWLEDHDLCRRLMKLGTVIRVSDCVVVHRGVKSGGRTSHVRFGYSQVANPLYLYRKKSFPFWLSVRETIPRVGKNAILACAGRERTWRRRRLFGNLIALRDLLIGDIHPKRILALSPD